MTTQEPQPTGALELWWEELRQRVAGQSADVPSTWLHDELWQAACLEAAGLEALHWGLPRVAEGWFRDADVALTTRASANVPGRAA